VKAVALILEPTSDLQSANLVFSNDYGTPNLLFLYYIPFLPDNKKLELDAAQDEFQSWNAWELGQTETQVIAHVKAGNLPSDDSIASRVTRNNYRSKAINFFRETSQAWLSIANNSTSRRTVQATQDGINGAILQTLRSLAVENQLQSQFEVILNVVSGSINAKQENKFHFTHVYYKYDAGSSRILPVVLNTIFTVQIRESGGRFTVETVLSTTSYHFDRVFWRTNRYQGEAAIQMGKPIRKQMALDFYVGS